MARLRQTLRGHLRRARRVERFARLLVGGGVTLIAGLWFIELFPTGSTQWVIGLGLTLLGIGFLGTGIWSQISY